MAEKLEEKCKRLIQKHEYRECEKKLGEAMKKEPHSAIPHNLMGILMENEKDHILAMKHFRAAYALDPAYIPPRYNMEQYGINCGYREYAYSAEDCPVRKSINHPIEKK
ncbi:MAG: hypothetical protein PUF77_03610 [Clostridiales bacterium]|nr:hypothetical protein [Clostridiales bacterium]